jgi:hypothetical protein
MEFDESIFEIETEDGCKLKARIQKNTEFIVSYVQTALAIHGFDYSRT